MRVIVSILSIGFTAVQQSGLLEIHGFCLTKLWEIAQKKVLK